ncbi:popeye domain-containing protein 3 [Culicoides brevitarsis]|uniref:popeye domain-containing protein 3 n=1 Tax=Culicoides brevitarsis TaxID=469753 RepID=UPI00307B2AA9
MLSDTQIESPAINHHLAHRRKCYRHISRDFTLCILAALVVVVVVVVPIVDGISYSVPISKQHTQTVVKVLPPDPHYDNDTLIRESMEGKDGWMLSLCKDWTQQPSSMYYHITYGLFLVGFLAPANFVGWIWLRVAVVVGSLIMFYWGWFHECDQDTVIWSTLFFIVNFVYLTLALIKLRPVKFDKEIEAVYVSLFEPLHVSRLRFRKIIRCMKLIRVLKYQEVYAQEKVTKVDSLSLVISGKLVVSQNQKALHIVFPHQFLDSPEWFGVSTDDYFQVSIVAMEESRVLIWHRDKLKLSIMGDPFLQSVIDHILGRDVVKKLMQVTQVNETMAQSNGFIISEVDEEDKPMLINNHVNHNGMANGNGKLLNGKVENGSPGITALINRQLQAADVNAWRLGRIEETDHETPV